MKRFFELRQRIFADIKKELEEDGHCKSYEGALTISQEFPCYFDQDKDPYYVIELHCYVIGPSRHYKFNGKTLNECIDKLENSWNEWTRERW